MSQGGGAEADEEGGDVDGDDWWPEVEDTLALETVGTIVLEAVSWASVEPSYDWWVHGLAPLRGRALRSQDPHESDRRSERPP